MFVSVSVFGCPSVSVCCGLVSDVWSPLTPLVNSSPNVHNRLSLCVGDYLSLCAGVYLSMCVCVNICLCVYILSWSLMSTSPSPLLSTALLMFTAASALDFISVYQYDLVCLCLCLSVFVTFCVCVVLCSSFCVFDCVCGVLCQHLHPSCQQPS